MLLKNKNLYLIYLIASLIMAFLTFLVSASFDLVTEEPTAWTYPAVLLLLIFLPAYNGGIMSVTISAHYNNEASMRTFYEGMLANYWKVIRLGLCILLLSILSGLVIILVIVLLFIFPPLGILASILFTIGWSALLIYVSFQSSILVVKDGMKSWESIKHSLMMLKKAFKKILLSILVVIGAYAALYIVAWLVESLLYFVISLFAQPDTNLTILYLLIIVFVAITLFPSLFALSVYVNRYKNKIEPEFHPSDQETV
jgi:hypothetical protein